MTTLTGKAVAYSAKGLPPFPEAPPLGLFAAPPWNAKAGRQRDGVWVYKLAVSSEVAQLVREVRERHQGHKEAMRRMPFVGEFAPEELGEVDTLDVEAVLPPDYRHYLYWLDPEDGRPLARWAYNNLPDEISWEGGEIYLRLSLFCYLEVKKGVERLHRFTPAGYRLEEHAPQPF